MAFWRLDMTGRTIIELQAFHFMENDSDYFVIVPVFYIVMIMLVTNHVNNHIKSLEQEVLWKNISVTEISKRLDISHSMLSEFDHTFSRVPFALLSVFFFLIPASFTQVVVLSNNHLSSIASISALTSACFIITLFILIVRLVWTASSCKRKIDESLGYVIKLIRRTGLSCKPEYASLVQELKELQDFQFTVCDIFTIHKSLIVSYFSSMISFNVLILQIQPITSENNSPKSSNNTFNEWHILMEQISNKNTFELWWQISRSCVANAPSLKCQGKSSDLFKSVLLNNSSSPETPVIKPCIRQRIHSSGCSMLFSSYVVIDRAIRCSASRDSVNGSTGSFLWSQ